jgi:hypothetical protein
MWSTTEILSYFNGQESGGRYCLIDMFVPDGSGPLPHRHDGRELRMLILTSKTLCIGYFLFNL